MANESRSYLCGLFRSSARSAPRPTGDDNLRGVEFSARSSFASSTVPAPATPAPAPVASSSRHVTLPPPNLNNPELSGYYSPPAPLPVPRPDPSRELRGYYAPEPVIRPQPQQPQPPQPIIRPTKMSYK
ncbi:hypothetical protein GGS26DRAFT_571179 [Hypomontagnella submonticulosa]|nr:hypothetical protein GGS26DRAFT_571179 [Hypomontagnella submonticulosa]